MNTDNASLYVKWLKQEVAPALGCTEPVAISFTAAYAAQYLDQPCTKISGFISAMIDVFTAIAMFTIAITVPGISKRRCRGHRYRHHHCQRRFYCLTL